MVKLSFETEVSLDLFPKEKRALLRIQEQELSDYIFESYKHHKEINSVIFYGAEGKETATVKYDVLRIW